MQKREESERQGGWGQGQGGPQPQCIVPGSIHLNKETILTCVPAGRGFVVFRVLVLSPPLFPPSLLSCKPHQSAPVSPQAFPLPPWGHNVPFCDHHRGDLSFLLPLIYPHVPV